MTPLTPFAQACRIRFGRDGFVLSPDGRNHASLLAPWANLSITLNSMGMSIGLVI